MNDLITLIPVEEDIQRGSIARQTQERQARTVYARVYPVSEREYYDAAQAGYELTLKADVWAWDWAGERLVEYAGERYRAVRVYENRPRRTVELTCERVKGRRQDGAGAHAGH